MTGEAITIEPDDIVVNWRDLLPKPKKILQWKLRKREYVEVIGGRSMTPDGIDVIILKKIKLKVYELSVSPSTFEKLKHFVKVPPDVEI